MNRGREDAGFQSFRPEMGWMPLSPPTASRCAKLAMSKLKLEETASMREVTIVGVDVAKNVFQLHGAASDGSVVFRKKLSRLQFPRFDEEVSAGLDSRTCGSVR